jgi:hypothetical protein
MPVITIPVPPPMRDKFIGPVDGRNTDQNTGMSQPWVRWILNIFTTLSQQVSSINGSTVIDSSQANLGALASTLGPANSGQQVYVTDYNHVLRWDGTGFGWGPGENGSGYISAFLNDPSPTTGWQLCDGSGTTKLNSDGTVSAITTPNYATASYLKLGTAVVAGPTAASGVTGATSAGTPTGTNSNPATGNNSANVVVAAGVGTTVAADPHTHTTTAPVFTGNALGTHTHSPGSIELQRTQLKGWYRR